MNFGQAIEELKAGKLVAREGWNGKGMWIAIGVTTGIQRLNLVKFDVDFIRPCLVMRDAQGLLVPGWLASQTDILADDWVVVPG